MGEIQFRAELPPIAPVRDGYLYGLWVEGQLRRSLEETLKIHVAALSDKEGWGETTFNILAVAELQERYVRSTELCSVSAWKYLNDWDRFLAAFFEPYRSIVHIRLVNRD